MYRIVFNWKCKYFGKNIAWKFVKQKFCHKYNLLNDLQVNTVNVFIAVKK